MTSIYFDKREGKTKRERSDRGGKPSPLDDELDSEAMVVDSVSGGGGGASRD
jgi:hypothetical protein